MSGSVENVVNKVCALGCYSAASSSAGMFLQTSITNNATKKNNVVDSSICSCKEESRTSYGTLWLVNAHISFQAVNFTDNICYSSAQKTDMTCSIEY